MFRELLVAYFTNAACTLSVLLSQHPVSERLLGRGKTVEGLLLGLNAGLVVGLLFGLGYRYVIVLSLLSLFGDLLGSFVKRRLSVKDVPLLDQAGFLVLPLWFAGVGYYCSLTLLFLTLFVHRLANVLAYRLHLKSVPY